MKFTIAVIDSLNEEGKIEFSKTKDEDNKKVPRFTVTLGVIPDYMFDGKGMRIDGISEGKRAEQAGMLAGDIVIKMGKYDVEDMMSYMHALSKFKKGDTTEVLVKRKMEEKKFSVTF